MFPKPDASDLRETKHTGDHANRATRLQLRLKNTNDSRSLASPISQELVDQSQLGDT
jgi:hypothetical protein